MYQIKEQNLDQLLAALKRIIERADASMMKKVIFDDPDARLCFDAYNLVVAEILPVEHEPGGACGKPIVTTDNNRRPCKLMRGHGGGCNPF